MPIVGYFSRSEFCKLLFLLGYMVLQERIELSTSPLPRECSTTELLQRRGLSRGLPRGVAGE